MKKLIAVICVSMLAACAGQSSDVAFNLDRSQVAQNPAGYTPGKTNLVDSAGQPVYTRFSAQDLDGGSSSK